MSVVVFISRAVRFFCFSYFLLLLSSPSPVTANEISEDPNLFEAGTVILTRKNSTKGQNPQFINSELTRSGLGSVTDKSFSMIKVRIKKGKKGAMVELSNRRKNPCATFRIKSLKKNRARARGELKDGWNSNLGHALYNCDPDYLVTAAIPSNDPYYKNSSLWGLYGGAGIGASEAWTRTTGHNSLVIAVIDTGVKYDHPDLAKNIFKSRDEIPGNGIDDDSNGYIDDVNGINAINNTGNPMDTHGHGTHVAGTIGAVGNNSTGVVGVAWKITILPCKFLDPSGSTSDAIKCLDYVLAFKKKGYNIIATNNSWGGGGFSTALHLAIYHHNTYGMLFVAAAGNNNTNTDNNPYYPQGYDIPNVISVAAIDSNRNMASFSNYGVNTVDVAAPGVGILSTHLGNSYATLSGTSMATPHVTGLIALLRVCKKLTATQLKDAVVNTGRGLSSLSGRVGSGKGIFAPSAIQSILGTGEVCNY